jgi:hypothetical protein
MVWEFPPSYTSAGGRKSLGHREIRFFVLNQNFFAFKKFVPALSIINQFPIRLIHQNPPHPFTPLIRCTRDRTVVFLQKTVPE